METKAAAVDNRRTFCDHCSLRTDLPGFIGWEHATGNKEAIESGELFKCHMIHDPTHPDARNRVCLGAALAAGAELANPVPTGGQSSPIYDDLEAYRSTQQAGRRDNLWLEAQADKWAGPQGQLWYGWWTKAPVGNWHYLMTTLADNANNSVYLFFDQAQQLCGPLELWRNPKLSESPPRYPAGQVLIDRQKERLTVDAAEHGWTQTSYEPLILNKDEKQIMIEFNSAGLPKSAKWLHGDEFSSMGATGYMDLNELYRWFTWGAQE